METLSFVPGRIRLKEKKVYKNERLAQMVNVYLLDLSGINKSRVNPNIGTIVVEYDIQKIDIETLKKKIDKILNTKSSYMKYLEEYYEGYLDEERKFKNAKKRMFIFGGIYILFKIKQRFFGKFFIGRSLPILKIAALVTIIKSYPTIKRTYRRVARYFPTDADKLLLVVGTALTLSREGNKGTLLLFLKAFTDALQSHSKLQIERMLLDNNPNPTALVWYNHNNKEFLMPVKALEKGDIISCYKNETLIVDGIIEKGNALVNYIYYSGQPDVRLLEKGQKVHEGMTIVSGNVKVRVTNVPEKRPKSDLDISSLKLKQKVTAHQERAIYFASTIAFISYLITGTTIAPLSVLLVMSPSASKVAFNAGLTNYLKLLLKHKIILRNINTIEKVINANSIVFDKTGTLTKGRLTIVDVSVIDSNYSKQEILQICAEAESEVSHPVAYTLVKEGQTNNNNSNNNTIYIPSKGVISEYNGEKLIIGNIKLIEDEQIEVEQKILNQNKYDKGYIPVYVGLDDRLIGVIYLAEEIETSAVEMVEGFKSTSIKNVSVISGDLKKNTEFIANRLNIESYKGELTPNEKEEYVNQQKKQGSVIMVGDGINDTKAMKASDISITYCSDVSQEAVLQSDCLLTERDMELIPKLINLSNRSYYRIQRNIEFTKHYNFVFGILCMLGYINPFSAKSINTLNSIIAMYNSSRITKIT